jgi:hypothetical protein
MREVLENMEGYAIVLTPHYLMEEADWVVLRLLRLLARSTAFNPPDMNKAIDYLESKYPYADIQKAYDLLRKEETS